MRIKITTNRIAEPRPAYLENDELTVDDDTGTRFVQNGWAIDMAGNVEPGSTTGGDLEVQNVKLNTKAKKAKE